MTLQICRWTLAFIWIYQGIVPKWLGPHPDELAINMAVGATLDQAMLISRIGGTVEILMGLAIFCLYRSPLVYAASGLAILALHVGLVLVAPVFLVGAFNAMTINAAIMALSLIAWHEQVGAKREGDRA